MRYKRIFVISDLHAPYCHPDALEFIKKVNKEYKPDCVVNIGDELDFSSSSYHEPSTQLDSPSKVLAVPLPVITLLSALLFMVVPLMVEKLNVPEPSVTRACPFVPSLVG